MKVLLISDVHANLTALEAVAAAEPDAELTLFAGDMVDFGYFPHEVIAWFRSRNCICVAGNHDREMVALSKSDKAVPRDGALPSYAQYNLSRMTREDLEYLAALPNDVHFEVDGIAYYMTHYYEEAASEFETCFERQYCRHEFTAAFESLWRQKVSGTSDSPRRILLGHTHRTVMLRRGGEDMILNPGAVGYQLGADCLFARGADYMVIDNGQVMPRHVDYDTAPIRHMLDTVALSGQARETAECIFHTILHPGRREEELRAHLENFSF